MIRRSAALLAGLILAVSAILAGAVLRTAGQSPFFRNGDTVTIIVPFAPGGGFDTYARLVAPFFEQELQKLTGARLNVVVTNLAGAGGQTAIERIYGGRPDGRTLAIMSDSVAISQAVLYNAPFDLTRLTYLAQVNRSDQSLMIRVSAFPGVNTFTDLVRRSQTKPVLMGTVGLSSVAPHIVMQLLLKEAGVDFQMDYVHFRGTGEVMASMLRRETEVMLVTTTGGNRYVQREPDLKWLVTLGDQRSPVAREVPTLIEQRVPNAERIARSMAYTRRSFIAPPRMSAELRELLAKAFQLAMTHKDLHVRALRADLPIDYEKGEVPRKAVADQIEVMKKFAPVLKQKLGVK